MSIAHRLNIAIGTLLIAMLLGIVLLIFADAGPRIEDESRSTLALTHSLVEASVKSLPNDADADARLAGLAKQLSELRHVHVRFEPGPAAPSVDEGQVSAQAAASVPVIIGGAQRGVFVITPQPGDEITEIWSAVKNILAGGIVLLAALMALTTRMVKRALAPVNSLVAAIRALGTGNYDIRLEVPDTSELKVITDGVQQLAADLKAAREENARLTRKLVSTQDEERRDIARELHDEIGPHLFAVRALGTTLKLALEKDTPDLAAADRLSEMILIETNVLQQSNRRVLQRLAPSGLRELGLAAAISAMIALRREHAPQVQIDTHFQAADLEPLDEITRLTVYRIVQEGLTNALRHSGASRIDVIIDRSEGPTAGRLNVTIKDNGAGLPSDTAEGFGLQGMRERVEALGGRIAFQESPGGGLELRVTLNLASES